MTMQSESPKPRGFAAWDPAKLRAVSGMGGKAAHQSKAAHQFSREEAQIAGRKGGLETAKRRRWKQEDEARLAAFGPLPEKP